MSFELKNPTIKKSVIAPENFNQFLESNYKIRGVSTSLLHVGFNDTYNILTSEKEYILRLYSYGWQNLDEINSELEYLLFLKNNQIPVAAPIQAKNSQIIFQVPSPEGLRYGVLFERISGSMVMSFNENHCTRVGSILGEIHSSSKKYSKDIKRREISLESLINEPLELLKTRFSKFSSEITKLDTLFLRIKKNIDENLSLEEGFIHGDFITNNLCEDENKNWGVFDFDLSGRGFYIYDLATFKWSLGMTNRSEVEALFKVFIDSYHSTTGTENLFTYSLIEDFVLIRHLWVWSVQIKDPDSFTTLSRFAFKHWFGYFSERLSE